MPMDFPLPKLPVPPTNYLQQQRIEHFEPRDIWQRSITQASKTPKMQYHPPFEIVPQFHGPFHTNLHPARPQNSPPQWPTAPKTATTFSIPTQTVLSQNFNTASQAPPNSVSRTQGLHAQNRQILTSPCPPQVTFQPPQPAPSDLLRKPSLYRIPAWPTSEITPAQTLAPTSQFQSHFSGSDEASNKKYQYGRNLSTVRHSPNSIHQEAHPSKTFTPNYSSGIMNGSSSTAHVTPARIDAFEVPRARTGRKHCPNLYVRGRLLASEFR